jgi:hypothetical protein
VPRGKNSIDTEKLAISTTAEVSSALDRLVKTGLFGKTRAEVAEALLRERLRDVIREGWLDQKGRKK